MAPDVAAEPVVEGDDPPPRVALALLAVQALRHAADARLHAATTIRLGGTARYCAGPAAPVVECATLAEWDAAVAEGERRCRAACH